MLRRIMSHIGYEPIRETSKSIQYFSPFNTDEKTPSFFILKSNSGHFDYYKDHGNNEKGQNYFSFLMKLYNLSFNDSVKKWHEINGTVREFRKVDTRTYDAPKGSRGGSVVELIGTENISNAWLIDYLNSRGINNKFAISSILQVNYSVDGRKYNSIGIKNESGGYNHRNKNIKGVIGKTDIAILGEKEAPAYIIVFEGMFNYLTHVQMFGQVVDAQYIIMNSTSNTNKAINHIAMTLDTVGTNPNCELWLDNGTSGDIATINIMNQVKEATDKRRSFNRFDDLNDQLTNTLKTKREIRVIKRKDDYIVYKEGKEIFITNDFNLSKKKIDSLKKDKK